MEEGIRISTLGSGYLLPPASPYEPLWPNYPQAAASWEFFATSPITAMNERSEERPSKLKNNGDSGDVLAQVAKDLKAPSYLVHRWVDSRDEKVIENSFDHPIDYGFLVHRRLELDKERVFRVVKEFVEKVEKQMRIPGRSQWHEDLYEVPSPRDPEHWDLKWHLLLHRWKKVNDDAEKALLEDSPQIQTN